MYKEETDSSFVKPLWGVVFTDALTLPLVFTTMGELFVIEWRERDDEAVAVFVLTDLT